MPIGPLKVQEFLYSVTAGRMWNTLRGFFIVLAAIGLAALYQAIQFKGLDSKEAMEIGQVARQMSDGKGFTTLSLTPVSLWVFEEKKAGGSVYAIRQPEITHAPVYPFLLSKLFSLGRVNFEIPSGKMFVQYAADGWICMVSETWFLLSLGVFYLTFRRICDIRIYTVSLILILLCNQLWRHAISGTPLMMLLFLFSVICYCVVRFQEELESWKALGWISIAGVALGLGFLTHYRFILVLLGLLTHLAFFGGSRRWVHIGAVALLVVVIGTPWVMRNMQVCGLPLGLATYAPLKQTDIYPDLKFEQSLKPKLSDVSFKQYRRKWMSVMNTFFDSELKLVGGNFLIFFFIVGLVFAFRSPQLQQLRYFSIFNMAWLILLLPFIWNPEDFPYCGNLLVLLVPLIFLFGTVFFFSLMDRFEISAPVVKLFFINVFIGLNSITLIFALLPPRPPPFRFPPYFPPVIQMVAHWMQPDELTMTDMPWAYAWYGNRPAILLTSGVPEFLEINDYNHKISAVYMTPLTLNRNFNEVVNGAYSSWAPLLFRRVPDTFPLRAPTPNLGNDFLFFTDRVRWANSGG